MDLEDRAYLLTATNQRWLSVRLDFLGGVLVFATAIMAAKGAGGLTAAQIALCLTYMVSIVQIFGMVTRQTAEVENNSESASSCADSERRGKGPVLCGQEHSTPRSSIRQTHRTKVDDRGNHL